jgi:hypothetical protein
MMRDLAHCVRDGNVRDACGFVDPARAVQLLR